MKYFLPSLLFVSSVLAGPVPVPGGGGVGGTNIFYYTNVVPASVSLTVTNVAVGGSSAGSATLTGAGSTNLSITLGVPVGAAGTITNFASNVTFSNIFAVKSSVYVHALLETAPGIGQVWMGDYAADHNGTIALVDDSAQHIVLAATNGVFILGGSLYGNAQGLYNIGSSNISGIIPAANITNAAFWASAPPGPTGVAGANGSNGSNGTNAVIYSHSFALSSGLAQTYSIGSYGLPSMINGLLKCTTADGGMNVGQEVNLLDVQDASYSQPYFSFGADTNNIYINSVNTSPTVARIIWNGARNLVTNWNDFNLIVQYQ